MMVNETKAKARVRALREVGKEKWESICVHQQLLPCGPAAVTQVPRDILCMQISHYGTLRKNSACLKMAEERTSFGRFSCKFEYFQYKIKNSSICCNLSARSNV